MFRTVCKYLCVLWVVESISLILGVTETASDSYLLWTQTTPANQSPVITSPPPVMTSPAYHYDVDATDQDGNVLTFTLSNAPEGMTIDASSGVITWTATLPQVGTYTPMVMVSDGNGDTASQTIPLTVRPEWFPLTVPFLAGVNLSERTTEQDATVLSLGVGTDMTGITDILLPDVPTLFVFSDDATFHFEYQHSTAIFAPESTVVQMAVVDAATGGEAYEEIHADDLAGLALTTPAASLVNGQITVVVQRRDGRFFKIGHFLLRTVHGGVEFNYAELIP